MAESSVDSEFSAWLTRCLDEACFAAESVRPVAQVVAEYFAPEFTQTTNGVSIGLDEFVMHLRGLRLQGGTGSVEVLDSMRRGRHFAHHHVLTFRSATRTSSLESFMFGELAADGRILRITESVVPRDG